MQTFLDSEIWIEKVSLAIQSKSSDNTKRLFRKWYTEKSLTNELAEKSEEDIKRYFFYSMKKLTPAEINYTHANLLNSGTAF